MRERGRHGLGEVSVAARVFVCVCVWAASLGEEGGEGRVPTADRCLGMKIGGMAGPVR